MFSKIYSILNQHQCNTIQTGMQARIGNKNHVRIMITNLNYNAHIHIFGSSLTTLHHRWTRARQLSLRGRSCKRKRACLSCVHVCACMWASVRVDFVRVSLCLCGIMHVCMWMCVCVYVYMLVRIRMHHGSSEYYIKRKIESDLLFFLFFTILLQSYTLTIRSWSCANATRNTAYDKTRDTAHNTRHTPQHTAHATTTM